MAMEDKKLPIECEEDHQVFASAGLIPPQAPAEETNKNDAVTWAEILSELLEEDEKSVLQLQAILLGMDI